MRKYEGRIKQFYLSQSRAHALGIVDNSRGKQEFPDAMMMYTNMDGQEIVEVELRPEVPEQVEAEKDQPKVLFDYAIIDIRVPNSQNLDIKLRAWTSDYSPYGIYAEMNADYYAFDSIDLDRPILQFADYSTADRTTADNEDIVVSLKVDMSTLPDDVTLSVRLYGVVGVVWEPYLGPFVQKIWGHQVSAPQPGEISESVARGFEDLSSPALVKTEQFFYGNFCDFWGGPDLSGNVYTISTSEIPESFYDRPPGYAGPPSDDGFSRTTVGVYGDPWPATFAMYARDPDQVVYYDHVSWSEVATATEVYGDYLGSCGLGNFGSAYRIDHRWVLYQNSRQHRYMRYGFVPGYNAPRTAETATLYGRAYLKGTKFETVSDTAHLTENGSFGWKAVWVVQGEDWRELKPLGTTPILNDEQYDELAAIPWTDENPDRYGYLGELKISRHAIPGSGEVTFTPAS